MTPVELAISDVRFTLASAAHRASGLLGFVAFTVLDAFRVDGVTVRRTRNGTVALAFPARRDASGRKRAIIHPVSNAVRGRVEDHVLERVADVLVLPVGRSGSRRPVGSTP